MIAFSISKIHYYLVITYLTNKYKKLCYLVFLMVELLIAWCMLLFAPINVYISHILVWLLANKWLILVNKIDKLWNGFFNIWQLLQIKVDLVYSKASTNSGSVVQFVHLEYARDLGKRRSLIIYVFTLSDYTIKKYI